MLVTPEHQAFVNECQWRRSWLSPAAVGWRAPTDEATHEKQTDNSNPGFTNMLKMKLRQNEPIQDAVRRFRRLVERSGLRKEVRRRQYYEKPSDLRRRARLRAERRTQRDRMLLNG